LRTSYSTLSGSSGRFPSFRWVSLRVDWTLVLIFGRLKKRQLCSVNNLRWALTSSQKPLQASRTRQP
jgi:hypothetical protein